MAPRIGPSMEIDFQPTTSASSSETTKKMSASAAAASAASVSGVSSRTFINNTIQGMTLDASSQHVGSVLRRQVGLLAGKTAKRRLNELRNTSRLPRAHHDFLSDHHDLHSEITTDAELDDLHKPMRLSWDEIFVEDMLGMGGFGSVCLVTCPKLRKQREREERAAASRRSGVPYHSYGYGYGGDDSYSMNTSFAMTADDSSFGGSMMLSYASTTTATCNEGKPLDPNKYYACKSLSNKTIKQANVRGFVQAAADLVHEAFLLSHISPHPNIVRLYGIPTGTIETAFDCGSDASGSDLGYFLILEALGGGILSDKVYDWKQKNSTYLRERNIARKRKEQQRQRELERERQQLYNRNIHGSGGAIPLPTASPSLGSFLGSSGEQRKSHTGRGSTSSSKSDDSGNPSAEPPHPIQKVPCLEERLEIALQIASGMKHLHAHGIVFRDLKPHNVGLSVSLPNTNNSSSTANEAGQPPPQQQQQQQTLTWRLFDFGLAREVPISARSSPSSAGLKKGSNPYGVGTDPSVCYGKAGSLRYMAPETMGGRWLRSKKNQSSCCFATFGSDVYSFAILLWELVGLQNFDDSRMHDGSPEDFESAVCDRGHRPKMEALDTAIEMDMESSSSSSSSLTEFEKTAMNYRHRNIRELVNACWREDYRQRPDFDFIVAMLKEMLSSEHERRRQVNRSNNTNDEEFDFEDENTIATDNLDFESTNGGASHASAAAAARHRGHHHHKRPVRSNSAQSSEGSPGSMLRVSGHSYRSGTSRSKRRLMKKRSARSLSSRSVLSNQSMSTHSMVLEDVFELETEHSGSRKSSNHENNEIDDDDIDDDLDDYDEEEMACDGAVVAIDTTPVHDQSLTSLMNESILTTETKKNSSSRYLSYNVDLDDTN